MCRRRRIAEYDDKPRERAGHELRRRQKQVEEDQRIEKGNKRHKRKERGGD